MVDNSLNGWSVTLVDSLSTMWIMDLKSQFHEAVRAIANQKFTQTVRCIHTLQYIALVFALPLVPDPKLTCRHLTQSSQYIPFFETVIRHLGGYLSAYALSKEPILLSLADNLGRTLLPAFNTTSGLPASGIQPLRSVNLHLLYHSALR